jgi:hypothetical protein
VEAYSDRWYGMEEKSAEFIEFKDTGLDIKGLISARIVPNGTISIFLALGPEGNRGNDCGLTMDANGVMALLRFVGRALLISTTMGGDVEHIGSARYLTSERDDERLVDTVGNITVQALKSRVRLVVRFDPRSEQEDFTMTLDATSAKRLNAMLDRIASKMTRERLEPL